ncbi:MAG: pseudouridine synthase [Pseudomonadota bacterium]
MPDNTPPVKKTLTLPVKKQGAGAPQQRRKAAPQKRNNSNNSAYKQHTSPPEAPPVPARRPKAAPVGIAPKKIVPKIAPTQIASAATVYTAPVVNVSSGLPGVRISKLLAERGLCSRREADLYLERGWVFVNGERINELGSRALPSDTISLSNEARNTQQRRMTILLHKPVGYVSGQPEPGFIPAVKLIQAETQKRSLDTPIFHASHLVGLAPAGRLDIDSTGLLVLTQDGRIARQLIGENSKVDKEYLVRVEGSLSAADLDLLRHGLYLDGKALRPAQVEWLNEDQLRFVLREGRKRQIRRMCEAVGLRVVGLKRVRIGQVKLSDLPIGQWRFLREDEAF